jgi:hypothetical protein
MQDDRFLGVWDSCPCDNQFRNVAWVECHDDGDVKCNLCSTGWMGSTSRKQHFAGTRHLQNMRRLRFYDQKAKESINMLKLCDDLEKRITWLPCVKSREVLRALMYQVLRQRTPLRNLILELERREAQERLTLVDLWLLKCDVCTGPEFRSMSEMREYTVLDPDFLPSRFLRSKWASCRSQFVTELVRSFVEGD